MGTTTIDFGAFPGTSHAKVSVTGQSTIDATSKVEAWLFPSATADHSSDEHMCEMANLHIVAYPATTGVGFDIHALYDRLPEPLESLGATRFRSAATSVYGYSAPSSGGTAKHIWGLWTVGWVWA